MGNGECQPRIGLFTPFSTIGLLASSSGKIDKYEYLTGAEILLYDQSRIIQQVKFTCSPLGEAFEK